MALSDRLERIQDYVRSGSIFPRGYLSHPGHAMVMRAFVHVLAELPEGVYDRVERDLSFFFDGSNPTARGCLITTPTVIIFERAIRRYSEVALAGLIAHEVSHLAYPAEASEVRVDHEVIRWGLADEIRAMHTEGG